MKGSNEHNYILKYLALMFYFLKKFLFYQFYSNNKQVIEKETNNQFQISYFQNTKFVFFSL